MFEALHKLGGKIAHLLGDPDIGHSRLSLHDYESKESIFSGVPFAQILPYESYDEETGLFIGVKSLGFAIEVVPLVGGDDSAQKIVSSLFTELMDEGSSLQCLLFADHRTEPFLKAWERAKANSSDVLKQLARKRAQYFNTQAITTRIFRFILSYSIPCEEINPHLLQQLKDKKEKFLETLKPLTYALAWKPDNLLEFVGGLINFSMDPQVHKRKWNPYQSFSSQLTTGGQINVLEDKLEWMTDGETHFKSYRAIDFPEYWSLLDMQRLIGDVFRDVLRLNTPFYLHFGVHCPKQSKIEAGFWKRAYLVENQARSRLLLRWIPELEKELKETDYIRKSLSRGARFAWTQLSVGIWGEKTKIHQHEEVLKNLFRINQFTLTENRCVHLPQFLTALPMTWAEHVQDLKNLNLLRTTITDECVNFVPLQGEWMGTNTPCMLLVGRRGQLMSWNPFDNKTGNYNVVIAGRSGTGKSVFMQDLLLNALSTGAKVFVLEVGRSFEKMNDLLDGQQIRFSKESNICLNPFTNICSSDEDSRNASISFLKSIIACMAAPTLGTSDVENSLIEEAIRTVWKSHGSNSTISYVASWLRSHEDIQAKKIGTMLTPYTKEGVYARYFEGKNNVDFKNSMVLIELEELKDKKDLQTVVLQLFIMAITNQAFLGDRKTPFIICIDEAWDLLRGNQSGPFIETLARRLRKYNGSLVIGTQGIEDFFATAGSKAAFDNSDWMCLLSQKKSSIESLAESGKLSLNEAKKFALESVTTKQGQFSEVMICDAEGNYSLARLVLDRFSEMLYTSKAEEFAAIKELQKQGHSITSAIENLCERLPKKRK
jgi:conjugal transfer ATP-binding protein TraC